MGTLRSTLLVSSICLLTGGMVVGSPLAPAAGYDTAHLRSRGERSALAGTTGEPASLGVPPGAQQLSLDDGSFEVALGVVDPSGEVGNQAVFLNRHTPSQDQLPLTIDTVAVLFPLNDENGSTGLHAHMTFQILVYVDEAGTGDPLHATLVQRKTFDLEPSNTVFQNVALDAPVTIGGGDVYVGFTNTVTSVTGEAIYPGALDENTHSGRSYAFHDLGTNDHFDGEDLSQAESGPILLNGTWLIRAFYSTGGGVQVCWDAGVGDDNPAPTNARLCGPGGGKGEENGVARGALVGFNVYRSTQPNVQPIPSNLFTSTGPNQTTAASGVAPGGSFFVITGVYDDGESDPSNEVSAVPATVTTLKVKAAKINAKGTDFTPTVQVFVDGIPFVSPAVVKQQGKKVLQKGNLITGQSIGAYLSANGNRARVSFRNDDGTMTTVQHPR